jgi:hypothetical protein
MSSLEDSESVISNSNSNTPTEDEDDLNVRAREDAYICLIMEKDLRHFESVRIKAQYFTGIILRVKNLTPSGMENITKAIDVDNQNAMQKYGFFEREEEGMEMTTM